MRAKFWSLGFLGLAALVAGCGQEPSSQEPRPAPAQAPSSVPLHSERGGIGLQKWGEGGVSALAVVPVDRRRSLAVTDKAILANFPLKSVLDQLVAQNGLGGFTSTQLFRQLWDTQNPAPGQPDLPGGQHCSDMGNTLNGFPYVCRPGEGSQALLIAPSATVNDYSAVGLYNRFDLAPLDGSDCGEYRIIYAKTGVGPGRNFLIFEAVLPNPRTDLGLEGCRPVADFWSNLTADPSVTSRGTKLRDFYFTGLSGFQPVIELHNFGNNPGNAGQVRTNQFIQFPWLLGEFKLHQRGCPGPGCTLIFDRQTVKTNPFGELFNPSSTHPLAPGFQSDFLAQVKNLAIPDINGFFYDMPDLYNVGQSDAQTAGAVDDYVARFGPGPSTFHAAIQNELTAIGSPLTPRDIVARAQSQSCGGCHQRSNLQPMGGGMTWPASAGFVHNSELNDPLDATRFDISPALRNVFLPRRQTVLEGFLTTPPLNAVFVSQSVPTSVPAGANFDVSVTMRNTGTTAWSEPNTLRLGTSTLPPTLWGPSRALLAPSELIHRGVTKTFTFTLTAPTTPGSYPFQWRMVQDVPGPVWFGPHTPLVSITVL